MSYFPERRPVDPVGIADALSESLAPSPYGAWVSYYGDQISLDTHAAVGNSNLLVHSIGGNPIEQGSLFLELTTPVNLANFEKFQFLIAAIVGAGTDNLTGTGRVVLSSSVSPFDNYASAEFAFSKAVSPAPASYTSKYLLPTDFVEGGIAPIDWSQIRHIGFLFDTQNVNPYTWDGYSILIDGGPFFLISSTPSRLAILAEDINGNGITGKHGTFVGPSGSTSQADIPFGPAIVNPGTWTVIPTDDDFVKWKDGDTNRTKQITVPTGGLGSATAVFESGSVPVDWLPIAIVGGVVVVSAGLIFHFLTKG